MTRSLVTGAAGFMGSHVARHCLDLGHEVVAVDDLSGGFVENVPEGAEFVRGSVSDPAFVDSLFERSRRGVGASSSGAATSCSGSSTAAGSASSGVALGMAEGAAGSRSEISIGSAGGAVGASSSDASTPRPA